MRCCVRPRSETFERYAFRAKRQRAADPRPQGRGVAARERHEHITVIRT
jgi:hypothetical protein